MTHELSSQALGDRVAVEYEVTTLYRGRRIYTVNCQNRPERATEITAGCARVLESFTPKP